MALILGVYTGSTIYVGDTPIKVTEAAQGSSLLAISVDGGPDIVISEREAKEVMPSVFMSVGRPMRGEHRGTAPPRVVIEAPREITILREELYERQHAT